MSERAHSDGLDAAEGGEPQPAGSGSSAPARAASRIADEELIWRLSSRRERFYRGLLRTVRILLRLSTRASQSGNEHLPRQGAVIVAGNHLSVADPFVLATAVARCHRRIRMMGTAGLFCAPVLGGLLRRVGYIPVDRRSATPADALAPALEALRAGQCLGLYPEGAITRLPEQWPARAKTGVVRLALDSGAPVVVLAQWGTHEFVGAEGRRLRALLSPLRRPRVGIRLGAPLDLRAALGISSAAEASPQQLRAGADLVMNALLAELSVLRGESPPEWAGVVANPPQEPKGEPSRPGRGRRDATA